MVVFAAGSNQRTASNPSRSSCPILAAGVAVNDKPPQRLLSARTTTQCAEHHASFPLLRRPDRKSTRLNSSHVRISYAVFCLKKKTHQSARDDINNIALSQLHECSGYQHRVRSTATA